MYFENYLGDEDIFREIKRDTTTTINAYEFYYLRFDYSQVLQTYIYT